MGVVRREGDWRLEKRETGLYEITYQNEPQEVVRTPEYSPGPMETTIETVRVHEVDSYAEAEGLFEERAHGTQPPLGGPSPRDPSTTETTDPFDIDVPSVDSDLDAPSGDPSSNTEIENLPRGAITLALLVAGGALVWTSGLALGEVTFQIGVLLFVGGLAMLGWAGYVSEDLQEAVAYLARTPESHSSSGSETSTTEQTPPAPDSLKHDIIFDRAEQTCEWCGEDFDQLEVHHIEPRSEGGPNTRRNLIALCPNCHSKADTGAISKTKLKAKIRRIEA